MTNYSTILDLFNSGHFNKAIKLAYQSSPDLGLDPNLSKVVAGCYFQIGEYRKSLELLSPLESVFSQDLEYLSLFAATYRRNGQFTKSQVLFEKALKINPNSISIRNNYANLLIDLRNFDEARAVLEGVLRDHPGYSDSLKNLNRLDFILKSQNIPSIDSDVQSIETSHSCSASVLGFSLADPLLLAFADAEVSYASKRYKLNSLSSSKVIPDIPLPTHRDTFNDQIKLAEEACANGDYLFTIKICSHVLSTYGANPSIYDCASDAYINLKQFVQAEICLLHSILLGGETPKRLLNLVSLACMRGDFKLAKSYLEKAASLDPSHPQLLSISNSVNSKLKTHNFQFTEVWSLPELQRVST